MLTWREYTALLIAGIWDFSQIALITTIIGLVVSTESELVEYIASLETFMLCSGSILISIALAILLKPHWALLPIFVLENTPLIQTIPNTTMGAVYIVWSRRKSLKEKAK